MQVIDFLVSGTYIVRLRDVPVPDSTAIVKGGQRIVTILDHVVEPVHHIQQPIRYPCLHVADVEQNAYFIDPTVIASAQFINNIPRTIT